MMENTAKLLGEIAELKEKLHKHDKAIARIESWYDRVGLEAKAREIEWRTLWTVLRIFKEEVKQ